MQDVFTKENIGKIQSDWVVTDNTTLTDAGITFAVLEEGRIPELRQKYTNWLSFLESIVLHEVTLADDRIFRHQPWIQGLKGALGNCIAGVDLGDTTRRQIKHDVRSFVTPRTVPVKNQQVTYDEDGNIAPHIMMLMVASRRCLRRQWACHVVVYDEDGNILRPERGNTALFEQV